MRDDHLDRQVRELRYRLRTGINFSEKVLVMFELLEIYWRRMFR